MQNRMDLIVNADEFLRNHGCTVDGRDKKSVERGQRWFESRRLIRTPMGGARKPFGSRITRGGHS